jgi:phage-related minor tail protein
MPKEKAAFSMKGFYEEFFAKEFQENDQTLARMAETQIKSLVETIPDLAKISPEMDAILTRADEIQASFEAIGNSVSDAFKGMLTGAMSWKDGMRSIIASVIDQLWKLFVVQKIVGIVSGALGGATGGASGGAFGSSTGNYLPGVPFKAFGGSVTGNKPYMVGERGPELFIPGGNGTIIPNSNMRGGGGGSSFNISVDARGSNDPAAVRAQVQQGILEAAPAIIAAAESRTISNLRRPRLGGAMQ